MPGRPPRIKTKLSTKGTTKVVPFFAGKWTPTKPFVPNNREGRRKAK
jgi:hypothetical protein